MPRLQAEAVEAMTSAFRRLESAITPPKKVDFRNSFVFRFGNKGIQEALLQKLARHLSGLNAVAVLLDAGFLQEVGVLFRTLDEIQEDIVFLASAETNGARSERHIQYLEAFYAESVFSRPEGSLEIPKPNLVTRKKIRAHSMNALGKGINPSQALSVGESISAAYSGYVHAASENIMEMYCGNPPCFHVEGMRGTSRVTAFAKDAENYVHRGLMSTIIVAKAVGDASLVKALYGFLAEYESANNQGGPRGGSGA